MISSVVGSGIAGPVVHGPAGVSAGATQDRAGHVEIRRDLLGEYRRSAPVPIRIGKGGEMKDRTLAWLPREDQPQEHGDQHDQARCHGRDKETVHIIRGVADLVRLERHGGRFGAPMREHRRSEACLIGCSAAEEQPQKNNHRYRHANKPKQESASHRRLL